MNLNSIETGNQQWDIISNHTVMMPNFWDYIWVDADYQFMALDTVRNEAYRQVINRTVKDKIVAEIGPGSLLFLTRLCVEAGAKKIYAVEINEHAYLEAEKLITKLGLAEKIELIYGSWLEVELPEKVDVCLSEIIGCIGGFEGAAVILKEVSHLLKPNGVVIPQRCVTWCCPVSKPDIYHDDFLETFWATFRSEIHQIKGDTFTYPYYSISNFPESHLIAPAQKFEDLDFAKGKLETDFEKSMHFTVASDGSFDGLLFWLNLYIDIETVIDTHASLTNWHHAYVPFEHFELKQADQIKVIAKSKLSRDEVRPDYFFEVCVWRKNQKVYDYTQVVSLS